jgi:molybdopterin-guanine dinucleotide biosynthesis protein B
VKRSGRRRILAFSGASGAGKTTLLVRLIPALVARGLTVAALKGSGHRHAFDRPGKDSARLRGAGALVVAVQGPGELAWFGPPREGGIRALARLLPPVDLIVAEGFRRERVPRVEVRRRSVDASFQSAHDPDVIAVVSDDAPPRGLPWFTAREIEPLADFVAAFASGRRARKHALASPRRRAHRVPGEAVAPRERIMATTRKTTRGGRSSTRRRTGAATVREAGRKGGRRTLERRGPEFYSRIGRKGGKSSGSSRRGAARRRSAAVASRTPRTRPSPRRRRGR